jgi:hypothetical protein
MKPFDYVSVIISVVIGLGLSHLLTGFVELVKARRRIRFYWIHLLWVGLTFMGHVFLWWSLWNLRGLQVWNFFSFLLLLLQPVLLFVVAAFLIPELNPEEPLDLRDYFYENHSAIFGAGTAFTVLMLVRNVLPVGGRLLTPANYLLALALVLLVVSAITKNARYHAAVGILFALWFLTFIILFGLQLGGA